MSRSPASILYDDAGNPVAVVLDGSTYRLATTTKLVAGAAIVGQVGIDPAQQGGLATETTVATLATESTLATIDTVLDTIDTTTQSMDGKLATIDTVLDTISATASTSDGRLATIDSVLDSIKDTDGIKKITDQLPTGTNQIGAVSQGTKGAGANGWPMVLYDASGNPVTVVLDGSVYRLSTFTKLETSSNQIGLVGQGTKGAGSNAWPVAIYDAAGNAVTISLDAGVRRLEVSGKVTVVGAQPPPATTAFTVYGDNPLTVGTHDTSRVIPNGQTFRLQQITAGNEDPTKGAVVEVYYNNGTNHIVERVYMNGQTVTIGFSDISVARDGTAMVGDGAHTIILRREKFAGTNIAIDAVVRGYTS